jgi:uncharacterized delta-60 repeat protein/uncharacterized repeat protein (TIGR01451 family)
MKNTIIYFFSLFTLFSLSAQEGFVDMSFNPLDLGLGHPRGTVGITKTMVQQSDGKILVGGGFTYYNKNKVNNLFRINSNGTLDSTFLNELAANDHVLVIAVQDNGKILLGGEFTEYDGVSKNRLVRLNDDGSIDENFQIGSGFNEGLSYGEICSIVIQSDGKILVGGSFENFNGLDNYGLVRLEQSGKIDTTFNFNDENEVSSNYIYGLALSENDEIFIGARNGVFKLTMDGRIDNSFNVELNDEDVHSILIQDDGGVIIGGEFTEVNSSPLEYLVKLNSDGTIDSSFQANGKVNNEVFVISKSSDNKILVGGRFSSFNGKSCYSLIRLNANGEKDASLNLGEGLLFLAENGKVLSLITDSEENIYVGGSFTKFNGENRLDIVKINNVGEAYESFNEVKRTGFTKGSPSNIEIDQDNNILLSGSFNNYNGIEVNKVVRIDENGIIDTTFNSEININATVQFLKVLPNGKKFIVFQSSYLNEHKGENRLLMLESDGKLDTTFRGIIDLHTNQTAILSVAVQNDGKIILTGVISEYDGVPVNNIVRINSDGSIDNSFKASLSLSTNEKITRVQVQDDSKIIVSGYFNDINSLNHSSIVRLLPDGSIDETFILDSRFKNSWNPCFQTKENSIYIFDDLSIVKLNSDGKIDSSFQEFKFKYNGVDVIEIQDDGKLLLLGRFVTNTLNIGRFCRLNANGTLDSNFYTPANTNLGWSYDVKALNNGGIIIVGGFQQYDDVGRNGIVKLLSDNLNSGCQLKLGFSDVQNLDCDISLASAKAKVFQGLSPYIYKWPNADLANGPEANFNQAGIYKCVVTDSKGCSDSSSIWINGPEENLDISSLFSGGNFRVGFESKCGVFGVNYGCQEHSGEFRLILDQHVDFISAHPSQTKIIGDTIIWDFYGLAGSKNNFMSNVILKTSLNSAIGDTVNIQTLIIPKNEELDIQNNHRNYYYPVINGYDPNDISVNPIGICDERYIDSSQTLNYKIRFQNTGNAEAVNIIVLDTLSNDLDLNSFRVLASSHDMVTEISNNVLKFVFDSIMLPDSTNNEPMSHGYIIYDIDFKKEIEMNSVIKNKADIYFDFNPAVITNLVYNTVVSDPSNYCQSKNLNSVMDENMFSLYPNPANSQVVIGTDLSQPIGEVLITDMTGKIVKQFQTQKSTTEIDVSTLENGIYFLKAGGVSQKLVKK